MFIILLNQGTAPCSPSISAISLSGPAYPPAKENRNEPSVLFADVRNQESWRAEPVVEGLQSNSL